MRILQPEGWLKPKGYSNGIEAQGRLIFLAGQIGWDGEGRFTSDTFEGQFEQCLKNIVALLAEAKAEPAHVVRLTWFITDKATYLQSARRIGEIYRTIMGRNFPAMSVVEVVALVEDRALVEIEATAVVPG